MTKLWYPPEPNLYLVPREVHIWRTFFDPWISNIPTMVKMMTADEKARADRFYFEMDSQHFIVGRVILRMILGHYLSIQPENVTLAYNNYGKPYVLPLLRGKQLDFNLSHSRGLAVYIFGLDTPVGIDVEYCSNRYCDQSIVETFYTNREQEIYQRLQENAKKQYFYHAWTSKEAYFKGLGEGLTMSLDEIEVLESCEPGTNVCYDFKNKIVGSNWNLASFTPADDYIGCYSIKSNHEPYAVRWWDISEPMHFFSKYF